MAFITINHHAPADNGAAFVAENATLAGSVRLEKNSSVWYGVVVRADTDRIRGAILHTMATEGSRSLSQFINQAVMAEVERLERKYNGGQPFPAVGARELPQGRPMGE